MAPTSTGKKRKRSNNNNIKTTTTTSTENAKPVIPDEPSTNVYENLLPEKISDQILRLKKPYYNDFFNKYNTVFSKKATDSQDGIDPYIVEVNELLNTWEYQYICSFISTKASKGHRWQSHKNKQPTGHQQQSLS